MRILRTKENVGMIMKFLRQQMTEERTDRLIDVMLEKIDFPKFIPKFIVRKILDAMLPGKVLDALEYFLNSFEEEKITPAEG